MSKVVPIKRGARLKYAQAIMGPVESAAAAYFPR
jgi:hypothetical protein